jgi:hypothetical protein
MRIQINTKKRAATIMAAWAFTVVTALTACGGQAGSSGQSGAAGTGGVASLPASAGQSPSGTQTPASSQGGPAGLTGVTIPVNAPPAEVNHIQDAWATCMENHGDHDFVVKAGTGGYLTSNDGQSGAAIKFPAAFKACKSLQPHPPWQEIPQYNPNYNRDEARWVSCMNQRGVPVTAVRGGFDFDGTSKYSQSEQDEITVECEMQAFNEN